MTAVCPAAALSPLFTNYPCPSCQLGYFGRTIRVFKVGGDEHREGRSVSQSVFLAVTTEHSRGLWCLWICWFLYHRGFLWPDSAWTKSFIPLFNNNVCLPLWTQLKRIQVWLSPTFVTNVKLSFYPYWKAFRYYSRLLIYDLMEYRVANYRNVTTKLFCHSSIRYLPKGKLTCQFLHTLSITFLLLTLKSSVSWYSRPMEE